MAQIYDFSAAPLSDRNGTYGGNSGDKEGIMLNGEYWIIKYPKSTRGFARVGSLSYSTSPLSEYIGSHIYSILGYPVHDTALGIRNDMVVVACHDLCDDAHRLIEFRQLKNTYNRRLNMELDSSLHSTEGAHFADLNAIRIHLQYNPELQNIPNLKPRFWDCTIIDGLINNNDRNNGNWGILRSKTESVLAPVYDNGGSFSPNVPDSRMRKKLDDTDILSDSALNGITAYSIDGHHNLLFRELLSSDIPEVNEAVSRTVPIIRAHMPEIQQFIEEIPERCGTYQIISDARKQVYQKELELRTKRLLVPAYEHLHEREQTIDRRRHNTPSYGYDEL